jgi:hypothetical protein
VKKVILPVLVLVATSVSLFAQPYTQRDLENDFALSYRLTEQIYSASIRTSRVLTDTFAPRGDLVVTHSVDRLGQVDRDLRPHTDIPSRTAELQEINGRMFLVLAQNTPQGEELRLRFADMLEGTQYRQYRWGMLGVVELLGARTNIGTAPSMERLKRLSPVLYDESREAVQRISFGFVRLAVERPNAQQGWIEHAQQSAPTGDVVARPGGPVPMPRPQPSAEGGRRESSPSGSPSSGNFSWDGMKELGSNMMNSVLDNLEDDFNQGAEWGGQAGQIIGTVSGMQDAVNTVAAGASAMDLMDAAVDSMLPDPYELVGHYAGGVIGMVGGAVGTAAGWIVGTVESQMAQYDSQPRRSGAGGSRITLF